MFPRRSSISINVRLTDGSLYNRFRIERSPEIGFWGDLGVDAKVLVGKYIRSQNCAFSDIFGPDLMPRVVALGLCIYVWV